ncbi:hypothetical protein TIFTF001_033215 [Ficus carica]|uniref:Uncharacterized protein n=1 Tax=Ficus carica TaxID=3494 RepID=A0AA88E1K4_FICCA|nr:hypothetical protein TIFTF001_033215 [Ficus carica]
MAQRNREGDNKPTPPNEERESEKKREKLQQMRQTLVTLFGYDFGTLPLPSSSSTTSLLHYSHPKHPPLSTTLF